MDTRSPKTRRPGNATLFEPKPSGDRTELGERVRAFALEVAKRHRNGRGDLNAMLVALRGWYRAWAICAPGRVPPLDEQSIALAIAAYQGRTATRRRGSAA